MPDEVVKRGISVGQAVAGLLTITGVVIAFYTQTQVRLNALEFRMNEKEKSDQIFIDQFEKINSKLDGMQVQMFDIKMEVMKKADKKD